jgi:hypothetical protein
VKVVKSLPLIVSVVVIVAGIALVSSIVDCTGGGLVCFLGTKLLVAIPVFFLVYLPWSKKLEGSEDGPMPTKENKDSWQDL